MAAPAVIHGAVKSGWLQRESTILRRWKPQFCVLLADGGFIYYTDASRNESEGTLHLPTNCNLIKIGTEITNCQPPPSNSVGCLIEIQTNQNSVFLCADSHDDAIAWKSAMVEVKNANVRARSNSAPVAPPPYASQPQGYIPPPGCPPPPGGPPTQVYTPPPQPTQQIIYTTSYATSPYYYRRHHWRRGYPVQTVVYQYPGQTMGNNGVQVVPSACPNTPFQPGPGNTTTTVMYHQYPPYLPY